MSIVGSEIGGVGVNVCHRKPGNMRKHFLFEVCCDGVGLGDGQVTVYQDGHFGMELVAKPAGFNV